MYFTEQFKRHFIWTAPKTLAEAVRQAETPYLLARTLDAASAFCRFHKLTKEETKQVLKEVSHRLKASARIASLD